VSRPPASLVGRGSGWELLAMCSFFKKSDFTADIEELADLIEDKVKDVEGKCKERDEVAKEDIENIEEKIKEVEEVAHHKNSLLHEQLQDLKAKLENLLKDQTSLKSSLDTLIKESKNDTTKSKTNQEISELQGKVDQNENELSLFREMFQQVNF
jgi:DNA polymerase III gamma/tau subunit